MSDEPSPEELLRAWRASAVPVEPRSELERECGIDVVRRAVAAEAVRKTARRRAFAWGAMAAAAALLIGFGAASWKLGVDMGERSAAVTESTELSISESHGGVVFERAGKVTLLDPHHAARLGAGDRLETLADGKALLSTDHSRWQLGRSTRVELIGAGRTGERVRLASGSVDVDVTKAKERKVVVETPDAELLVVGTAFSVRVQGEGETAETNVEVTRGVVWVVQDNKRQAVLEAGGRWSSRAERASAVPTASAEPAQRVAPSAKPQQGTLTEENQLFGSALNARNRGDNAAAVELFSELLKRFPSGTYTEAATVNRMQAYERLGRRREARADAKRYLARFPSGYFHEEAQQLLGE
jgi:hypothetical protein